MNGSFEAFSIAVAAGAVRSGTPILYAALGETLTERSGILNLGLEGIMLVGAWSAVAVSFHTGSPVLGILAACGAGMMLAFLHAVVSIKFRANQVASGIALMTLGMGLSAYAGIAYVGKKITAVQLWKLPVLSDLPVCGQIFFSHDVLVYLTYLLVPLMAFLLYRTRFGLAITAAGADPHVATSAGVRVELLRYIATVAGGGLAGIGGAYLSLVYAQGWIENLTTGRGLIAVGLVIFAAWNPWKVVLGAYLFGGAVSLQLRLQASGASVSPYLLGMAPYLLVIAVLVIVTARRRKHGTAMPDSLGLPYVRQT